MQDAAENEKNLVNKAEELCKIIEEKLYCMRDEINEGKNLL